MSKKVIAILPDHTFKEFTVEENINYLSLDAHGDKGEYSKLGMPIEKYILDEKCFYIALSNTNIPKDIIERVLKAL